MSLEDSARNQKAVLWEYDGFDRNGEPTVNSADEIDVRWEDTKTEGLDAMGQPISYDATVVVGQAIGVGSIMWLGEEDDLPEEVANYEDLYEVVASTNTPDIKGRHYRRVVLLKRYSNKLPEVV